MELKNIVLHQIIKKENGKPTLNCSDHLLPTTNTDIIEFVERFLNIYSNRSPTYGTFKDDKENYPFQKYLEEYLEGHDFLDFSLKAMNTLKKAIDIPSTKGGYVIFINYTQGSVDFVVTTMLDNSAQFAVNEEKLIIEKLSALNIDELVRANRVNINKWNDNDDAYLTFIKGKRDVSIFFQEFIGNTDLTSAKVNANNLKDALQEYMRVKGYDRDKKFKVSREIEDYIFKRIDSEEDIELDSISALVDAENPRGFMDYSLENDKNVSGRFRATKKGDFYFLHRTVVKGNGYKLEFDKELVKRNIVVRDGSNIIIKNVDKNVLDREFGQQNE